MTIKGLNNQFLSREVLESLGFARLGDNVLIHGTVVFVDCGKIALGSRIRIDPFVIISNRGGVEFGNNIHIGSHTIMTGQGAIRFEDFANVSHHVGIYTSNEDISGRTLSHPTVPTEKKTARSASIHFGRHCGVGAGSVVLPGARFGEGTILGAMSRTSRPLQPWTKYAGVPARRMSKREKGTLADEQEYLASLKQRG